MKAYGHWVLLQYTEDETDSGIISNQGAAMEVISVGAECPPSFHSLVGKKIYYKQSRSSIEMGGYICIECRDVMYSEEVI